MHRPFSVRALPFSYKPDFWICDGIAQNHGSELAARERYETCRSAIPTGRWFLEREKEYANSQ